MDLDVSCSWVGARLRVKRKLAQAGPNQQAELEEGISR